MNTFGDYTVEFYSEPSYWQQKIRASSFMVNGYIHPFTYHDIRPYIGAGIGPSYINFGDIRSTSTNSVYHGGDNLNIGYNLSAGLGFKLNERFMLSADFKHFKMGTASTSKTTYLNLPNVQFEEPNLVTQPFSTKVSLDYVSIGIRYNF